MTPLKIITEYSLLKSLIKIPELISFLREKNISVCGICDDELFGVMEFYESCKNNDIKPIIGLSINIDGHNICLYPKNYGGYQKLLKINTNKFSNENTFENIEDNNLFIVIDYKSKDIYEKFSLKKNVYISYQNKDEKLNALLITNSVLYAKEIRCFDKEDVKYLDYLKIIGSDFSYSKDCYFYSNCDEDDEKRLNDFVKQINIEMPFDKRYIPIFKKGINSFEYLEKLATAGLNKRLEGNVSQKYSDRLKEELNVINEMGFVDYFLIVYDYVLYAKKNHVLVGPGRGSAAGSLVSYAIGITDIDPIKYDLLFARFLNPYRKKMPDIDIDFEDTKRDMVISYVREKYGNEKVATGLTFNTLKAKLVLRDLARGLKVDNNLFEKFIKFIDRNKSLRENKEDKLVSKYLEMYSELNKVYDIAIHLENLKKNVSTHAAGIVISSVSLDEVIPIYKSNDVIQTGIAMDYLEKLGLLKMDFLALRNLTIIDSILKKIKGFNINEIDLNDSKVYELFKKADTDDIFQFESRYAKNNLLKLQVSNFEELCIMMAFLRPGPSNQIDEYVKNKNSNDYDIHPSLKEVLQNTYGVIIFQEQVMKILEIVGGYTLYEADNIRSAMSKKKEDLIEKERDKFISNALKKGYDKDFVMDIFEKIKKFAEYGFNKAHSVSYAYISYELAYFKTYYPNEFYITLLDFAKDNNDKNRLFNLLKMNKVKILKPNLNVSNFSYQFKNNYLLLPLNMVRIIQGNIFEEIINKKDVGFSDIYDFMFKCHSILNDKIYDSLVRSGLLDVFGFNHQTLIQNKDTLFNYALLEDSNAQKPLLKEYPEYPLEEIRKDELDSFGFYIGNHPTSVYKNVIKVKDTQKYLFKNIDMALLVKKVTNIKTKNNEEMAFISAEDETGSIEITLFPETWKKCPTIKNNDIILINGKSSKRYDKYQIIVNKVKLERSEA